MTNVRATSTYALDGMKVRVALDLPGCPTCTGAPTWTISWRPRSRVSAPCGTATGSVRDDAGIWALFERRGAQSAIRLDGVLDLQVDAVRSRAVLRALKPGFARAYLLRRSLPYLAAVGGGLVLHAAALVFARGAVLLCGEAGVGKSTLALAADAIGIPVLGDDHVALSVTNAAIFAHASVPFVDVSEASRAHFRPEHAAGIGKRSVSLRTTRPAQSNVGALCFVERGRAFSVQPMRSVGALTRLLRDVLFVADPADAKEHERRFCRASTLAERTPAWRIVLPSDLTALEAALLQIRDRLGGLPSDRPSPAADGARGAGS